MNKKNDEIEMKDEINKNDMIIANILVTTLIIGLFIGVISIVYMTN